MNPRLTRQELLRRGAAGGALAFPSLVAACGGGDGGSESSGELKDVLNFENWPYYMDTKETRTAAGLTGPTTLEQFDQEKGIKVNYYEGIDSNDGYFAKIQGQLSQGQGIGRDIIVATDAPVPEPVRLGGVRPEARQEPHPELRKPHRRAAEPGLRSRPNYSLPWLTGIDGIGWNEELTGGPVTSMTQLLTDPKLKGKVTLLGEMADTLGLVLIDNGDDPTDVSDEAFDRAIKSVQDALDAGQILKFTGNDYGPPLARVTSRRASPGLETRPARSREREPEMGRAREGRDHLDRQHVHPARRQRPDRVDLHELRLRPEDLGADRPRTGYISSVKGSRTRRSS